MPTEINLILFDDDELDQLPEFIDRGDITPSLTVLAAYAQAITTGHEDRPTSPMGALVVGAIENVVGWFADENGDPIVDTQFKLRAQLMAINNSDLVG